MPGRNNGINHPDPDHMTLHLESITCGKVLIPPPDTAPSSMKAALIEEPAGYVRLRSRRANFCVSHVMPGWLGKERQTSNKWTLVKHVVQQSLREGVRPTCQARLPLGQALPLGMLKKKWSHLSQVMHLSDHGGSEVGRTSASPS